MTSTGNDTHSATPIGRLLPALGGIGSAEIERHYATSAEDLWAALTEPERIARWLAPVTIDGERYRLTFGDTAEDLVAGTILECEPAQRLVVSWEFAAAAPTRVEARVSGNDSRSTLHLTHSALPSSSAHGHAAGWHVHLDDLAATLAGEEAEESWDDRWQALLPAYRRQLPAGLAVAQLEGDRGNLRFERRLETDLADAWSAVTEPERIARWFAPVTVEGTGEGAGWRTYWDDGAEYAEGVIRRCETQRLVEVTWTATDDADTLESLLRVTLTSGDDGVLLVLEHEGLVPADLVQYGAGWQSFLEQFPDGRPGYDWTACYRELKPVYERMLGG